MVSLCQASLGPVPPACWALDRAPLLFPCPIHQLVFSFSSALSLKQEEITFALTFSLLPVSWEEEAGCFQLMRVSKPSIQVSFWYP